MAFSVNDFDQSVLFALHSISNPALSFAAWAIATASWAGACEWLIVLVFWKKGHKALAAQLALALIIGTLESEALKHIVHRARPSDAFPSMVNLPLPDFGEAKYSFPSAHSAIAAAFSTVLLVTLKDWRAWLAIAFALLIGLARVYQGLHWPSDVLAGWALGVLAGLMAIPLSKSVLKIKKQ